MQEIKQPYIPSGRTIGYVPEANLYMKLAKDYAQTASLDKSMPGAAVIVKNGRVIGIGSNGSDYHEKHGCKRKELQCKTGEGYELCEGCHPKNHSEPTAIASAKSRGKDTVGADLYLWGHWWCCESCWDYMIEAGIKNVYLLEGSEILFNREQLDNIIGHQFDI